MIIIRSKYFSEESKERPIDKKDLAITGVGLGGSAASLVHVNKWGKNYLNRGINEINIRHSKKYMDYAKKQGLSKNDAAQKLRSAINEMSHGSKAQLKAAEEAATKSGNKIAQSMVSAAKSGKLARKHGRLTAISTGVGLGSLAAIKYRDHKWKKDQNNQE